MTKESLLDEHAKYAWECDESEYVVPYSKAEKAMDEWAGYLISNSSHTTTTLQVPKHILDEYAKKQVMNFIEWVQQHHRSTDTPSIWLILGQTGWITDDQLYSKFIEQQQSK